MGMYGYGIFDGDVQMDFVFTVCENIRKNSKKLFKLEYSNIDELMAACKILVLIYKEILYLDDDTLEFLQKCYYHFKENCDRYYYEQWKEPKIRKKYVTVLLSEINKIIK